MNHNTGPAGNTAAHERAERSSTVQVPHSFFKREKADMYGAWPEAFWRELVQNSVDADASRIGIGIEDAGDHRVQVTFADNGRGMDRDTIENVFFQLGATTKTDGDTVGGFGRARILTCFAQESYQIRTRDLVVQGRGPSYRIQNTDKVARGTVFRVICDDTSEQRMRRDLLRYLSDTQLPARVDIDGARFQDWCYKGRARRTLLDETGEAWGTIHVNKSDERRQNMMLVRVSGAKMFDRYIHAGGASIGRIVVEISPERSRDVLTGSRDNLHQHYQRILDRFIAELSADAMSALRTRRPPETLHHAGRAGLRKAHPPAQEEPTSSETDHPSEANTDHSGVDMSAMPPRAGVCREGQMAEKGIAEIANENRREDGIPRPQLQHDVVIRIETDSAAVRSAARRTDPSS